MSNGKIRDAEIELELSGDRRSIDKLLLTGQKELRDSIRELTDSVNDMKKTCEDRALVCPGIALADPVTARANEEEAHELWLLRTGSRTFIERVGLPLVLVLLTIALTRVFG